MKTTCEELSDKIVDYVDDELPADEAEIVAWHLSECPRCRQTANDLKRSLDLAQVLWQDNLGEATAAHATLCPHGHTGPPNATRRVWGPSTNRPRRAGLYALAATASMLLVVGVLVRPILRQNSRGQPLLAEQIERQVARAGLAAELLAATQMLARCEGTESIVERQYQYILREYADTPVAKTIRAGLGSGGM